MKTLYESIIKSNGANLSSGLKDLLTAPINDKNLKKLSDFWHKWNLDIPKYEWICVGGGVDGIGYEYRPRIEKGHGYHDDYSVKDVAIFDNKKSLLTIILHRIVNHNIDFDTSKYVDELIKLFNMNRQEDMDYIYLSFK